jgi:thioredoxin reductase (NADPH)
LNLPHESELWGRFLHNCALCDGDVYGSRGSRSIKKVGNASNDEKSVVVIGGGDAAVEAVSLLARIGVHTIHWIHRREEFRANAAEVEKVRNLPNVQTWTSFVVVEWVVKESSSSDGTRKVLDGVRIVGSIDGVADPGATSSLTIPCDGAFLMIGSDPNTKWLKTSGMDIDSAGLIRFYLSCPLRHPFLEFLQRERQLMESIARH